MVEGPMQVQGIGKGPEIFIPLYSLSKIQQQQVWAPETTTETEEEQIEVLWTG